MCIHLYTYIHVYTYIYIYYSVYIYIYVYLYLHNIDIWIILLIHHPEQFGFMLGFPGNDHPFQWHRNEAFSYLFMYRSMYQSIYLYEYICTTTPRYGSSPTYQAGVFSLVSATSTHSRYTRRLKEETPLDWNKIISAQCWYVWAFDKTTCNGQWRRFLQ